MIPPHTKWVMVPILFWLGVLTFHLAWKHEPRLQAAMRYPVNWATEFVWEYTGNRPIHGEELILFGRQGNRYHQIAVTLVAYLAPRDEPVPSGDPWLSRDIPITDFFSHGWMAIPDWPQNQRLFVGYQFQEGVLQFWEPGPWPDAPLANRPFIRHGPTSNFLPSDRVEMGMVDIRLIPEGTAMSRSLPNRYWEIRGKPIPPIAGFLLGAWVVLLVLGCWKDPRGRVTWVVWNFLHAVLAWSALASIAPSQYLWTSWFHGRMGGTFFWYSLPLLQLLLFPPLLAKVSHGWTWLGWKSRKLIPRLLPTAVVCFLSGFLVVAFATNTVRSIYGDDIGAFYSPYAFGERHNPLSSALFYLYLSFHDTWALVLLKVVPAIGVSPEPMSVRGIVMWFVVLWSPVYLLACWGIASLLGRSGRERFVTWCLLVFNKFLVLQFGYLEVYGPALAVMAVALWLLLRGWLRDGGVVLSSSAAFFSYLFHLGTGAMLPFVALLWVKKGMEKRFSPGWIAVNLLPTLALAVMITVGTLATYYNFKYDRDWEAYSEHLGHQGLAWLKGPVHLEFEQPFLSFTGELHFLHSYPALSLEHFSQWTGGLLFSTGPIFPATIVLFCLYGRRLWRRMLSWAALSTSLIITGASFIVFNYYPYPRDWDLFAIPGFLQLICFLVLMLRECPFTARQRMVLLLLLGGYLAWDGGIWLAYNLAWGPPAIERPLGGF